jgi:hypothetical protein
MRYIILCCRVGDAGLARYRCYFVDKEEHIRAAENIEADNLEAALDQARALLAARSDQLSLELWQGASRVYPPLESIAET